MNYNNLGPRTGQAERTFPFLALAIALAMFLLSPVVAQAQAPDTPPSVAGGRENWGENCAPCHGPTGQGDGPTAQAIPNPVPDFTDPDLARQLVPAENFDVIKNGRIENMMPPWDERLSDEQIWDTAALVWYLGPPPANLAAGETLYADRCAACHGDDGGGDGPEAPAQMLDFTDLELMVQASQNDLLAGFEASEQHASLSLSEAQLWPALDYIRTFSFAVPQQTGLLTGQALNATTGDPLANAPVTLRVFQGPDEIETLTGQTDAAGNYTFENLSTDPALVYLVEGQYQDITFQSGETAGFTDAGGETRLDLMVYEPTTDAGAIEISQLHYVMAFTPETINVLHILVAANQSDRAYVGAQNGQTLSFPLPEEAQNVFFQGDSRGDRFIQTDSGYADTEPVVPGQESAAIVANYDIPYQGDALTLELPLPADVEAVNLLLAEQGVDLTSEQIEFVESRQIQGDDFSLFAGRDLIQSEGLTMRFSNLNALQQAAAMPPEATIRPNPFDQNLARWFILGGGLIAIAAVAVYAFRSAPPEPAPAPAQLAARQQRLLILLARLDETFEKGQLDEPVYRRARAKYKAELATLTGIR